MVGTKLLNLLLWLAVNVGATLFHEQVNVGTSKLTNVLSITRDGRVSIFQKKIVTQYSNGPLGKKMYLI